MYQLPLPFNSSFCNLWSSFFLLSISIRWSDSSLCTACISTSTALVLFFFRLSLLVRNLKNPLFPFPVSPEVSSLLQHFCLSFSLPNKCFYLLNPVLSPRFFCVPHEACSALIFFIWRDIAVTGFQEDGSPDMAEICFFFFFLYLFSTLLFFHSEGIFFSYIHLFRRFGLKFSFKLFRWA